MAVSRLTAYCTITYIPWYSKSKRDFVIYCLNFILLFVDRFNFSVI